MNGSRISVVPVPVDPYHAHCTVTIPRALFVQRKSMCRWNSYTSMMLLPHFIPQHANKMNHWRSYLSSAHYNIIGTCVMVETPQRSEILNRTLPSTCWHPLQSINPHGLQGTNFEMIHTIPQPKIT